CSWAVPVPLPFPTRRSSDLGADQFVLGHHLDARAPNLESHAVGALADRLIVARQPPARHRVSYFGSVPLDHLHIARQRLERRRIDRKSTRLNSSHVKISYAV